MRYYRDAELDSARSIIAIIKKQAISVRKAPVKVRGDGDGTRFGHFEVWFSRAGFYEYVMEGKTETKWAKEHFYENFNGMLRIGVNDLNGSRVIVNLKNI